MSANLADLYAIYAELESIPAQNAAAASAATAQRSATVAAVEQAKKSTNDGYDRMVTAARSKQQTAHTGLESQLRSIAQSAGAKGSIPDATAVGTGRSPDFAGVKALDAQLGRALEDKRRLEFELEQLRQQLAHEAGQARAKVRDAVTFSLFGAGIILAVVAGANVVGALITIVFALVMQSRLGKGPSTFMNRQAAKRPSISFDTRAKAGVTRVFGAWYILLTSVVTAVASSFFAKVHPFWIEQYLWRWVPVESITLAGPITAVTASLFWLGVLYGFILLINGYRRRAGK